MPGPEHEALGGTLFREIERKIEGIPGHVYAFSPVGSTRFEGTIDDHGKEADFALRPATRVERTSWPSLVIEVGYSERLDDLHSDASWWLRNSQGRTRFVIVAKISRDPFTLRIECWKWGCPETDGDAALWIPKCRIPKLMRMEMLHHHSHLSNSAFLMIPSSTYLHPPFLT